MQGQFALFMILSISVFPLGAQWLDLKTPGLPRTADGSLDMNAPAPRHLDGHSDMSGLWVPVNASGSLFDPDKIQPWARQAMDENATNFYADDPRFHCLPSGPGLLPAGASVTGMRRIVQHPDVIAVFDSEMNYRQIFMDGRKLEENPILSSWAGYSVGHWEDDTLVMESNGFNDKTWLTREGLPHTDQLRTTERYRRPKFGHIELEVTYEDPGTFTEPVVANVNMEYRADTEILEAICNESTTGRSHYSGEITQAEEDVVEVPEERLASYVGTYQGIWLNKFLITTEFVLEDGVFYLIRTPAYSDTGSNEASRKYKIYAQSENAFDCTCGLGFVFHTNEEGVVDVVDEVHVSGPWPFERVK